MKRHLLLLPVIYFLTCSANQQPDAPSGLMVEFIREPENVKILDLKPEFSWVVPQESKKQTSFQILVASTKENIEKNAGDIWDSRKIMSSSSSEVEYGGNKLSPGTTYYWKVRIWNDRQRPTGYSEIQHFKTGDPESYSTTGNRFCITLSEPVKLLKTGKNHYFADFGKDAFGTLVLELNPVTEDTVIVHLGEKTDELNHIDREPGGSIRYHRVLLPVKPGKTQYDLQLAADKRNTGPAAIHLPDSLGVITPFRYCELENCNSELIPQNIHRKTLNYFFNDNTSSFTSSDTLLNKIWDLCKYSIKATSFTGIYVDGDRERIPYEADAYINQMGHYYTDREYSMARMTNEYFIKHPTWPTEWILHTIPMFYYDFMYTGNIESASNYYEELKHKTLISLAREDGLISSKNCTAEIMKSLGFSNAKDVLKDIVDWPSAQKDTGWKLSNINGERDGYEMVDINTVVNSFYFHSLEMMSLLSGYLGKTSDSVFYRKEALKVRTAFNKIFLDKSTGIYTDGEYSEHSSLHANMMALAFGLVPEEDKKSVIDFIKSRGMVCSVYGSQYLLEGLYGAGEADYALSLLTATNDRSWWNMIRSGSTITMEAWDMKYKPNSDWNHAWGAAPANIIPRFMWGITPAVPGYAKAVIKPQLSSLKYSKISVPTIRGNIEAEFKEEGSSKSYSVDIPANMECDFILININDRPVSHNGKRITMEKDTIALNPGPNKIIIN